ncbi:hypothetical protein EYF80_067385 [Liparis tanakae]|uniref:Uncharacterized protein n=1 Tax=Liparis tanakae TaxID=230148 RepID=A0A4Z2E128_9TELE|nr:hypothetical protein EYF80_067385 [Liparis tanakae]
MASGPRCSEGGGLSPPAEGPLSKAAFIQTLLKPDRVQSLLRGPPSGVLEQGSAGWRDARPHQRRPAGRVKM